MVFGQDGFEVGLELGLERSSLAPPLLGDLPHGVHHLVELFALRHLRPQLDHLLPQRGHLPLQLGDGLGGQRVVVCCLLALGLDLLPKLSHTVEQGLPLLAPFGVLGPARPKLA